MIVLRDGFYFSILRFNFHGKILSYCLLCYSHELICVSYIFVYSNKSMFFSRFIGFFGATADVVSYGLELLETQHLIQLKRVDLPNSKTSRTVSVVQDCDKISRLFQYAHQVNSHFSLCGFFC